MIGMSLQLDPESKRLLERLARECPDAARKAFYRAASIIRRKMVARMNNRRPKVAPWQDITRRIREMAKAEEVKTFGGRLMHPNGRQIAIKPVSGGGVVVGWVDSMEEPAIRFQRGGTAQTSASWRQYLYRRGFERSAVPQVAVTPERPVVDPVAEESAGKFPEWMIGAMKTILEKRIKNATLRYNKTPATEAGARAARSVANAYSALAMITEAGY